MMKKLFSGLIALTLLFALSACGAKQTQTQQNASPVEGKKITYILNMPESEIFSLCAQGCQDTAKRLGMDCDVFFSGGDDTAFQEKITACAEGGYDGLFLSHGGESYSWRFLTELLGKHPDLKLVTFDTQFKDEGGAARTIDGVTQFFQDDAGLAESLLSYVCDELYPEKDTVNVLKVWIGDYIAAFDRREVGYSKFEASGKIHTVDVIAPTDHSDDTASSYQVTKAALEQYKDGEIDAVWVAYDDYAQGCYQALKELGRDIPLVSVDICNEDIRYMLEGGSVWKACACTDFKANGEQGVRILALELAGEYDKITAPGSTTAVNYIEMPASLITQDLLKTDTTIENIYEVAPESYGASSCYVSSDWLKALIGY